MFTNNCSLCCQSQVEEAELGKMNPKEKGRLANSLSFVSSFIKSNSVSGKKFAYRRKFIYRQNANNVFGELLLPALVLRLYTCKFIKIKKRLYCLNCVLTVSAWLKTFEHRAMTPRACLQCLCVIVQCGCPITLRNVLSSQLTFVMNIAVNVLTRICIFTYTFSSTPP